MKWLLLAPGTVLLVMAVVAMIFPPRRINWWYGYRTPRSMRSQAMWDDANSLASPALALVGFLSTNTGGTCWLMGTPVGTGITVVTIVTVVLCLAVIAWIE